MSRRTRKRLLSEEADSDSSSSDELSVILKQLKHLSNKVSRFQKKRKHLREPSPVSSTTSFSADEATPRTVPPPPTFGLVNYEASDSEQDRNGAGPSSAIPEDFLVLLGKNGAADRTTTEDLNNELVQIWSKILQEGLDPEVQATILKKYSPPPNLSLATAPKLNLEILSVLTEQHKQRDQRLSTRQNHMGAALVAVGKAITSLLTEGGGAHTKVLLEWLSDAGRLLADIHHEESSCRRTLVSVDVDKQLRATLTNVSVDGWLFGHNLGERVKAARELEKLSSDLRIRPAVAKPPTSLNFKSLPRGNFKGYRGRQKYTQKIQTQDAKGFRKLSRSPRETPPFYRRNQAKNDRIQTMRQTH